MVTVQRLFYILDACNNAYSASDCGVICYHHRPGDWFDVEWKKFHDWRENWGGFTAEEEAEIADAESKDFDPEFSNDHLFKLLDWAITTGRCFGVYALKHFTADDVEKIHKFAGIVKALEESDDDDEIDRLNDEIDGFWDDDENSDASSAFYAKFQNGYHYDDLIEVQEGGAYYDRYDD